MKIKVTVVVGIFFIILGTLFGIIGNKLENSEKLKDIEYYITKDYKAGVIDKETFDNLIEKYRTLINSVIQ